MKLSFITNTIPPFFLQTIYLMDATSQNSLPFVLFLKHNPINSFILHLIRKFLTGIDFSSLW